MNILVILVIVLLFLGTFGGYGGWYGTAWTGYGAGSGVGLIVLVLVILNSHGKAITGYVSGGFSFPPHSPLRRYPFCAES